MPIVAEVSFRKAGKVHFFDCAGIEVHEGDFVIAETARGLEFGEVMIEPRHVSDEEIVPPLKRIIRKATAADFQKEDANREKERWALKVCQEKIQAHGLQMKLIDVEYCFDGSQATFYFSAESRVDFRSLVKDLAGTLKTKIQLLQVGVRDEAKLFGGLGPCGRSMCCSTFLSGFEPISMKMAKEQSLFLNPLKFSGICGKLMCCLRFEYDTYKEAKATFPSVGSRVSTKSGPGKVTEIDILKGFIVVQLEDDTLLRCGRDEITLEEEIETGAETEDQFFKYNDEDNGV